MKKSYIILMLMIIISLTIVSASTFDEYLMRGYTGNDDTSYRLRNIGANGIDIDSATSCAVGYGNDKGTYPIFKNLDGVYYSFLLFPSDNSVRIINSNCTEINNIALSDVSFYGTMGSVTYGEITDHVIMGKNASSGMYSFYNFRFNEETLNIEYHSKKDISTTINESLFQGVTCGTEQRTISDPVCSIAQGTTLYLWDILDDTMNEYTIPEDVSRYDNTVLPYSIESPNQAVAYGKIVDIDNDGNNEIIYNAVSNSGSNVYFKMVSFDLISLTSDYDFSNLAPETTSLHVFGLDYPMGTPCQIGGYRSDIEMCYSGMYATGRSDYGNFHIIYDKSGNLLFNKKKEGVDRFIPFASIDIGNDGDYEILVDNEIYDSSYTLVRTLDIDSTSGTDMENIFHPFIMDMSGDGLSDILLSNGELFLNNGSFKQNISVPSNANYVIGGDINRDFENEIIISSSSNTFIYSTNATEDYIIGNDSDDVFDPSECSYPSDPTESECDALDSSVCSSEEIVDCYSLVPAFDCEIPDQPLSTECSILESQDNDCNDKLILACYDLATGTVEEDDGSLGLSNIFTALNNNKNILFGILLIMIFVVGGAHAGIKNPYVLTVLGVLGTVFASVLGLIPSTILIIMIVTLALLMFLGMTLFKSRDDN